MYQIPISRPDSRRNRVSQSEVSEGPRRIFGITDVSVRGAPGCVGLSGECREVRTSPQLDHYIATDSGTDRHTPIPSFFGFGSRRPGVRISPPRPRVNILIGLLVHGSRAECCLRVDVAGLAVGADRGATLRCRRIEAAVHRRMFAHFRGPRRRSPRGRSEPTRLG